jgi:hypothetical protein
MGLGNKNNQGHGNRNQGYQESDSENWAWLKDEIKSLKLQSTNVTKEIESLKLQSTNVTKEIESLQRKTSIMEEKVEQKIGISIAMLADQLEEKMNKTLIRVQDNEKTMYQMNSAWERNYLVLEKKFQRQVILTDLYSKRQNLIIYGIPEKNPNENIQETSQSVVKFIKEQLKIEQEIKLIDCHRLKKRKNEDDRSLSGSKLQVTPIIIRLANLFDKDLIFRNLKNLKPNDGTKQRISVHTQLPTAMYLQKRKLTEKCKSAKLKKQKIRWMIDYNTADYFLEIEGSQYYADKD